MEEDTSDLDASWKLRLHLIIMRYSLLCLAVKLKNGEQRRDELAAEPSELLSVWWPASSGGCLLPQTW